LASWMVPAKDRADWRKDLTRRVWHWCQFLAETDQLTREHKLELARFCWNAFPAAFWRRFDRQEVRTRLNSARRSPRIFLYALSLGVLVLIFISGIIPALHSLISSPIPDPDHVCVISLNGKFRRVHSETLLDLAAAWKESKLVTDLGAFSWGASRVQTPRRTIAVLSAQVTPDFFQVLGLDASLGRTFRAGDDKDCGGCIVLSHSVWRLQFHSDPHVIGRSVGVDGRSSTIVGVLPRDFYLLSPEISVWTMLDTGTPSFTNSVERIGAVARVRPGTSYRQLQTDLVDRTENAGYILPASLLVVTSGRAEIRKYGGSYLLFLLLAVGSAILIVYARSSTGVGRSPISVRDRLRWWSFLLAKTLLLLGFTGLLAWTALRWLSVSFLGSVQPITNGVALWLFLVLSIAPLSWAIRDQQRRCRVCLQRLGTPIQIGGLGHVLLDWSGTEMVCPQGHGVLYLPDSQANWLERDRWDNLDESWAGLFKD
jgi:MacB-like periplasmic core domain